jgi:dephospho-CoA kinase
LNSQLPISAKVQYADHIINNSGTMHDLERQVDVFVKDLEKEAGWLWRLDWLVPPFGIFSALWTLAWRAVVRLRSRHQRRSR